MTSVTTQLAYVWALVDALAALAATPAHALEGVVVTSAPLGMEDSIPESIAVVGIPIDDERWDGIGNYRREETYEVLMTTFIVRPGADEAAIRAAAERAYDIYNVVASLVRSNPTLGVDGVYASMVSHCGYDPAWRDRYRGARLDWSLRVQAVIEVV